MTDIITTIGLDLAKSVFQVHGANSKGRPLLKKRLRRAQLLSFFARLEPCLIGMEACGSAHYWARELMKLGHEVRLIAPQFVKPFVKTNKNDSADAEAICEAVQRPTMRFAPIKNGEQQSVLMLHRARELLVRQKTQLLNALRGHCAEFGIVVPQGAARVGELIAIIEDDEQLRRQFTKWQLRRQFTKCTNYVNFCMARLARVKGRKVQVAVLETGSTQYAGCAA